MVTDPSATVTADHVSTSKPRNLPATEAVRGFFYLAPPGGPKVRPWFGGASGPSGPHLAVHGHAPDGRLFVTKGYGNGPVSKETYSRVWRHARAVAFSTAQQRSSLARRPYDLRHAAVSLWLNSGVPATRVAEWAGHSVHVLLKVYAKCIDGQDDVARRGIEEALRLADDDPISGA